MVPSGLSLLSLGSLLFGLIGQRLLLLLVTVCRRLSWRDQDTLNMPARILSRPFKGTINQNLQDTANNHVVELLDDSAILKYVSFRFTDSANVGDRSNRFPFNIHGVVNCGVASGPSKTTGLAKFQSDFTGFTVSFFWAVMCVSQSRIFHEVVSS